MNTEFLEHVFRINTGEEEAAVMILVVSTQAGAPQIPGARMLVSRQGRRYGTIGGGQLEKLAEEHAISMLNENIPTDFKTFDLGSSQDATLKTGMICGGQMSLYFEHLSPPDRIIIYGYGHIGKVLAPLAAQCGFHVIGVDERCTDLEYLEDNSRKNITLLGMQPEEHARSLMLRSTDSIVIMTHAHLDDLSTLKAVSTRVLSSALPRYIGMIGSKKKNRAIMEALKESGVSRSFLNMVRAPIGLSLGGGSPTEIAVSIMAEIQAVKYGKMQGGEVESMSKK